MELNFEISAERASMKDVVKCLLSSILFHRLFGPAIPQTREVIGVTYPCVANSAVDSLIEEKASHLVRDLKSQGQIGIQFFDKQQTNKPSSKRQTWFSTAAALTAATTSGGVAGSTYDQESCWEQWIIKVNVLDGSDRDGNRKRTEAQLIETLTAIVTKASSNKDHIPPITTTDSTPFPYQIVVGSASNDETWGAVFKKMLE